MPQSAFPWTSAEAPSWDEIQDKPATFTPPNASPTTRGGVLEATHIANAAGAAPTAAEYDALLAALIAAGIMAAS